MRSGDAGSPPASGRASTVTRGSAGRLVILNALLCGFLLLVLVRTAASPPALATPTPSAAPATPVAAPLPGSGLPCPCEEIAILAPGPGARVADPVTVSGVAASPFEQTVVVSVLDGSAQQVGIAAGVIAGELGERGRFTVTVPFEAPVNSQPGRIQVFTESPRDGAMEHLSSVTVELQGLDLDALLEELESALAGRDVPGLEALMASPFRLGRYGSDWITLAPDRAMAEIRPALESPGRPVMDFSVDARRLLGETADLGPDVQYIYYSTGWGPGQEDDAFFLIGRRSGQAAWVGLWYVARDRNDYR